MDSSIDRHERFKQLLLQRNTLEFLTPQESLVFVYGSLKKGHHNEYIMYGAKYVCRTVTKGTNFKMVSMGSYPGVTWGCHRITGEVYAVSDLHLELLDCLEGEGDFYKRHLCRVREPGETDVWIYVLYEDFMDSIDPTGNIFIVNDEPNSSMEWKPPISR